MRGCLLLGVMTLLGCATPAVEAPTGSSVEHDAYSSNVCEAIRYNIGKLPDRDYVQTYGDAENPRPWYTAAEALGAIGKPAIPALIKRLDTHDPYELKLALYALMLASQDPLLQTETDGDYLRLGIVLTEERNAQNRRLALKWWRQHQHVWP